MNTQAPKLAPRAYLDRFRVTGRRAVVTGGGRGIGLACAEALAEAGAEICITDSDADIAGTGLAALKAKGFVARAEVFDVTDPAHVGEAAQRLNRDWGLVDILVCNAGIARSDTPAEKVSDEHWRNVIDVNLNGVFWCCRAFGGPMLEAGRGAIVNVGSMSGFIVNRPQPQSYYNASKAAVHHLTKSLAVEWAGRGVRVNAVAPTFIHTDGTAAVLGNPEAYAQVLAKIPLGRTGEPMDVAGAVVFLASPAARMISGASLLIDGGWTSV